MALSSEDIRRILDEDRHGQISRFRIEFVPRLGFRLIREETLAKLVNGAVAAFSEWSVESIAFLPVDGNPNGVKVTLQRMTRRVEVMGASVFAITPLVAGVAVLTVIAFVYSVHSVSRLGTALVEQAPGAVGDLATGFKIGTLAALAGVGFIIYKAVIE